MIGAGPAGSATAYRLARAGASVLLLDRARFPRDKPCGGGITGRALRQSPISIEPVVEERVDRLELRLRGGSPLVRQARQPLILMTQRRRLDLHLAECAAAEGAEFRDGVRPLSIATDANGPTIAIGAEHVRAEVVVAADGANGTAGRAVGLDPGNSFGVAYEGNVPYADVHRERYRRRALVDLGEIAGGYSWIFPKGDHVNVGVGGSLEEGPRLRQHLGRFLERYGISASAVENLRGHRLPLRRPRARLANERSLLVGDAAGLVDPLSGDGIFESFVSARLAAAAILDLLEGRSTTLEPYTRALSSELGRLLAASWGARRVLDRFPAAAFSLLRLDSVWHMLEGLIAGDLREPGHARGIVRAPLRAVDLVARVTGDPGRLYRAEAQS